MANVDTFQKHLVAMRSWLNGTGYFQAAEALEFVKQLEVGFRKDGATPKFAHQLSITHYLATLTPYFSDPEVVMTAGFLHDVMEDHAEWDFDALSKKFSDNIAVIVWTLSKKTPGITKTPEQYFSAIAECPVASIVKPADRMHNLQSMSGVFTPEKQLAYVAEVEQYFFPMIRAARRNFPRQFMAYENVKMMLQNQIELIKLINGV